MFSNGSPAKKLFRNRFLFLLFAFSYTLYASDLFAMESFFVTIEKVELKNASGEWMDVIEPDRRLDLTKDEPTVSFFNNGRIAPGDYSNVRVSLISEEGARKKVFLERKTNYSPALSVRKGSFVNVSFEFDPNQTPFRLESETVKEVRLTVDEDERLDGGDSIRLWS
jgi:hypothetical protein